MFILTELNQNPKVRYYNTNWFNKALNQLLNNLTLNTNLKPHKNYQIPNLRSKSDISNQLLNLKPQILNMKPQILQLISSETIKITFHTSF